MSIKKYIIREVGDSEIPPPFFIRVKRYHNRFAHDCYIFPIAIIMLLYFIIDNILKSIWYDLRAFLYELEKTNKMKDESYKE